MDRRAALELALAASAATLLGSKERNCGDKTSMSELKPQETKSSTKMPSIFIAHGSPLLLDDAAWVTELAGWSRAMPRPSSVLMISAHWVDKPITFGATRTVPLVYDFYGFPQRHYEVTYPAPGAPELAARVRTLLADAGSKSLDSERGLDHGAYVPLVAMAPEADVPVLQMSIPSMDPKTLLALGRTLAPLRREGVLIAGSGFLTHNLRTIDWGTAAKVPTWASEFDEWTGDVLRRRDADALVQYREKAPGVHQSLPTHEHFVPVLVALGASLDEDDTVAFPIKGFTYGSFTKRSVQFG